LSGAEKDRLANEKFIASFLEKDIQQKTKNMAGLLSLEKLAWFLKYGNVAAVVSVNTGIMHLAALLDVPTVGLHGPTNPLRWGPLGQNSVALLPKEGKFAYLNLGFEYPPGTENVLRYISVGDVCIALSGFGIRI
jgi:ADP-heptose:LPS heptosyltransferase